jgi:hypothetical protein
VWPPHKYTPERIAVILAPQHIVAIKAESWLVGVKEHPDPLHVANWCCCV